MVSTKTSHNATADVFNVIAHPVRRDILSRLAHGEASASELAEPFDISRPAVSQHLGILEESGLVGMEKRGRRHVYSLRPTELLIVLDWLHQFEKFWPARLDALENLLDRMADEGAAGNEA